MDDQSFFPSVYRLSLVIWAIGAAAFGILTGLSGSAGWTVGSALSVGVVRSLEITIRRNFVPGAANPGRGLKRASLLRLPTVIVILVALVLLGGRDFALVIGFCAGALVVQAAIVLKTLGALVTGHVH